MNASSLIAVSMLSNKQLEDTIGGVQSSWNNWRKGKNVVNNTSYDLIRKLRDYLVTEGLIPRTHTFDSKASPQPDKKLLSPTELKRFRELIDGPWAAAVAAKYKIPRWQVREWTTNGRQPKRDPSLLLARSLLADPNFASSPPPPPPPKPKPAELASPANPITELLAHLKTQNSILERLANSLSDLVSDMKPKGA